MPPLSPRRPLSPQAYTPSSLTIMGKSIAFMLPGDGKAKNCWVVAPATWTPNAQYTIQVKMQARMRGNFGADKGAVQAATCTGKAGHTGTSYVNRTACQPLPFPVCAKRRAFDVDVGVVCCP